MATTKKKTELHCHACNAPLDDSNCRRVPSDFSYSGYSAYCVDCEAAFFDRLASIEGRSIALFHTCAALNIPLKPIVLDGIDFENCDEPFRTYINALSESGQDMKRGKVLGFESGCTALQEVFGRELSHKDFTAYIDRERTRISKHFGTNSQREKWGELPIYKGLTMTNEIYDELDRQFSNRLESLKGITITPQVENTLLLVCKNSVIYDFLMRQGLVKPALDVQKSIDLALSSEQLRKKDEKPIANFTPDAWITALEKAGVMKDGQFMPLHEIEEAVIKMMKGRGYDQTLDAAHQLELNIVNNARRNADQQTIFELPEDMKVSDELGEFASEESEDEREAKRAGGLTTVRFENEGAQPKPSKSQEKKKSTTATKKKKEAK